MKKSFSKIMLVLLLINIVALNLEIRLVKVESVNAIRNGNESTVNYSHSKEYLGQVKIIKHKISHFELETMRKKIGILEEGEVYNKKINGHGTGLRPPTEKEWIETLDKIYFVEKIILDDPIPSSVDHSEEPWFPPIGDQSTEGSCTAWAVGYYMKTYQEAKEHEWNLSSAYFSGGAPTPKYRDKIFSPEFVYHLINRGEDYGSSFFNAINLVCTYGICTWKNMPYDPEDHASWPSEEAWREAPLYRGNSSGFEYMDINTTEDIVSLKNWIAVGHLALIGVDGDLLRYDPYSNVGMTHKDILTLDGYIDPEVNHANTIVGYDDNIEYEEEGEVRRGAFKVANSWGKGDWESIYDGFYWISYETMRQLVGYCMFFRDRINYDPKLMVSFKIDHPKRGECNIQFGIGNMNDPIKTKGFNESIIKGGNQPFCPNNIVLDITELAEAVPSVDNQSFFMRVYDKGVYTHSGTYQWYSGGEPYSWFRLGQTFEIPETGATLKFWNYFEIEKDWDYGYVEVHDLNTDEWFTLPGLRTISTLPERQDNPYCPSAFEPKTYYDAGRWNAFTGYSDAMYQEEMNLTHFAGHTIELYFTYWTDPYVLKLGWYVDDIEIPEIGFFDDVEGGPGNWTYNGWSIATPPEPATGTLQYFSIEYYNSYISNSLNTSSVSNDVPLDTVDQKYIYAELTLTFKPTLLGDLNGDCTVNIIDLNIVARAYGTRPGNEKWNPVADLNDDDVINIIDMNIVARQYGKTCTNP